MGKAIKKRKNYPYYTREEKLSCKLSDDDILEIRHSRQKGESVNSLAKRFDVVTSTIYRWLLSDEERKERGKRYASRYGYHYGLKQKRERKRFRARKLRMKKRYRKFENDISNEYHKNNKFKQAEARKRMIKKYGKSVWNKYHVLRRKGIYMSLKEIKKLKE